MVYDFHTHTFLSDGSLSPVELARRAYVQGYKALGITDHAGLGTLERVIKELIEDCRLASKRWDILVIPGVELTHVPPGEISRVAKRAKDLGARIVVVHGETIVEPVQKGTNTAALKSPFVDVLAHPGLIGPRDVELSAKRGIFLELSARKGHSVTNGHLAKIATDLGAPLLLDSDAHEPEDLLTESSANAILLGSGLTEMAARIVAEENPRLLLEKLSRGSTPKSEKRR